MSPGDYSCVLDPSVIVSMHLDGSEVVTVVVEEWRDAAELVLRFAGHVQAIRDVAGATLGSHAVYATGDDLTFALSSHVLTRSFSFSAAAAAGVIQRPVDVTCEAWRPAPPPSPPPPAPPRSPPAPCTLDVEFSIVATEGPAQASPAEAAFQIELAIARWQPGAELRLGLAHALTRRAAMPDTWWQVWGGADLLGLADGSSTLRLRLRSRETAAPDDGEHERAGVVGGVVGLRLPGTPAVPDWISCSANLPPSPPPPAPPPVPPSYPPLEPPSPSPSQPPPRIPPRPPTPPSSPPPPTWPPSQPPPPHEPIASPRPPQPPPPPSPPHPPPQQPLGCLEAMRSLPTAPDEAPEVRAASVAKAGHDGGSGGPSCTSLVLVLPQPPSDGCTGAAATAAARYAVEVAVGGDETFTTWEADASPGLLVLSDLQPYATHKFRTRRVAASGAVGAASPPTKASMVGLGATALAVLAESPRATSTTSASVHLDWPAAARLYADGGCQPDAALSVWVQHRYAGAGAGGGRDDGTATWQLLLANIAPTDFPLLLHPLRCPSSRAGAAGCAFRVAATNVAGATLPSAPSTVVSTLALPAVPPGAARLQLTLGEVAAEWRGSPAVHSSAMVEDLSDAMAVPLARLAIVETRLFARDSAVFVVFDVLPPSLPSTTSTAENSATSATTTPTPAPKQQQQQQQTQQQRHQQRWNEVERCVVRLEQLVCCGKLAERAGQYAVLQHADASAGVERLTTSAADDSDVDADNHSPSAWEEEEEDRDALHALTEAQHGGGGGGISEVAEAVAAAVLGGTWGGRAIGRASVRGDAAGAAAGGGTTLLLAVGAALLLGCLCCTCVACAIALMLFARRLHLFPTDAHTRAGRDYRRASSRTAGADSELVSLVHLAGDLADDEAVGLRAAGAGTPLCPPVV